MFLFCCILGSYHAASRQLEKEGNTGVGSIFKISDEPVFSLDSILALNEDIASSSLHAQDSMFFSLGVAFRKTGDYNLSSFYFYRGLELNENRGINSLKDK